ncbi:MAG: hypothetical protein FWC50_11010 [Planctomycetaceae bacterium]|nr:hypothetical protein [Planctomycetaceae bacterium]
MSQRVPDQGNELLNSLVSQSWIVYRNPGSTLFHILASNEHPEVEWKYETHKRNKTEIEHVWKFGYGKDVNKEQRVFLGVDAIYMQYRYKLPKYTTLSSVKEFKETYPGFICTMAFYITKFEVARLTREESFSCKGGEHLFKEGTSYVLIEAENIQKQTSDIMGNVTNPHRWTVRLLPVKEDGVWLGDMTDENKEIMPKFMNDTINALYGYNQTHKLVLIPFPYINKKTETKPNSP